jgi:hypothetical protein
VNIFPKLILPLSILASVLSHAGPHWASGKITSLSANGNNPAIRLTGNVSPDKCDGGGYGWLYFFGTAEERQRVYATALALSMTGQTISVYTNNDGTTCRITTIEVLGLNQ